MKFSHKLLDSSGKTVKTLDKAMWLLCGTNLKAQPRIIGNKNKSIADVAVRAFMDTIVYDRYTHPNTTPTRHIYEWVDVVDDVENAGAEEVDTKDGFKTFMQVNLDAGVKSLSKFEADPDFPSGPTLRIKKHARIKILLQDLGQDGGFCHKIYIAHKRGYLEKGLFIGQMILAEKGEIEAALEVRNDKIAASSGTRKTAYMISESKDNGNWAQVEKQLSELDDVEPVEGANDVDGDAPESNGDERELLMPNYNGGDAVNMFTLEGDKRYGIRRNSTPGFWDWNPKREDSIKEWYIMQQAGYKIDLNLTK